MAMEEAAAVRRTAVSSLDDVEPEALAERIEDRLDRSSVTPGVLTVVAAEAAGAGVDVAERAAGVQLIYEGLSLTRTLADDPPWTDGRADDGDLDILMADILVARGFYLLAHTEAADDAVGVVRSFGGDMTRRRTSDDLSLDSNLERDVLELAVVAGATADGGPAPERLRAWAAGLGEEGLPAIERVVEPTARDRIATLSAVDAAPDAARTSAER
jgi:hypothetical protein